MECKIPDERAILDTEDCRAGREKPDIDIEAKHEIGILIDSEEPETSHGSPSEGQEVYLHADVSEIKRIYSREAAIGAIMVGSFVLAVAHLALYPLFFGTDVIPAHEVPEEEIWYFHHGWSSMLVIFFIEVISVALKVWSTYHHPVLAKAVARKLENNIGALIGEYIVVAATYLIMGCNIMPVFREARTGRRVYGVRYMEWLVDACGLVFLDCRILFNRQLREFWSAFVWTILYVLFGLWSAIAPTWTLYWVFLMCSWLTFAVVCYMLIRFLRQDQTPLNLGHKSIKPCILGFIITWWILYGVLFMLAFQTPEYVPQWFEQLLWTGMDVIMKLSHTVVLMAWRATQWDIDSFVSRQKAEAQRLVAQLDRECAIRDRDNALLRARLHKQSKDATVKEVESVPQLNHASTRPYPSIGSTAKSRGETSSNLMSASGNLSRSQTTSEVTNTVVVNRVYQKEFAVCGSLCVAFAFALAHLYVYKDLFGVKVVEEVPELEKRFFHHGWSAMLVTFLIEAISVMLKVWSTWNDPLYAKAVMEKIEGNLGALFGEYLVVGATYVIMAQNMMPVFLDPRTGRRVYGVRYMEWAVDACGLVYLDCHCLFNKECTECRSIFVWTVAYMLFGLWAAVAPNWILYWLFLIMSWLFFFMVCYMLIKFLLQDPYPREPFGKAPIKSCILAFVIFWWVLYGVLFMLCFQAPNLIPQWLEQLLWTGMDVVMKLSHTVVLIAWRATQWDADSWHKKRQAERERRKALAERDQARRSKDEIEQTLGSPTFTSRLRRLPSLQQITDANWTSTPGLQLGIPAVLRLETWLGEGAVTEEQKQSMMRAEDYAQLQRLEQAGSLPAQLHASWAWQLREQTFLSHGVNHISYNPGRWAHTLFTIRGRAPAASPCLLIIFEAIVIAVLAEIAPSRAKGLSISNNIHALVGGAIMFLVVFRTQYAFRKWWDGRVAFSRIVLLSRTLAQQICAYVSDDVLCEKMVKYVIATVVATRCHLRNVRIDTNMLIGVLPNAEIENINQQDNMPYYATWIIRSSLGKAVKSGFCLPLHMAIDNALRALEEAITEAERLLTPMPFIYVVHLRSFLFLYLLGLPFVLVSDLGRLMVVAVALASYLLIGLENIAVNLENPFGVGYNDLPLDLYCLEVSRDLFTQLNLRANTADSNATCVEQKESRDEETANDNDGNDEAGDDGD